MQTPEHITIKEFSDAVSDYMRSNVKSINGHFACVICDTPIRQAHVLMAVKHPNGVECSRLAEIYAGRGYTVNIPFCPNCEERPKQGGCLHVERAEAQIAGVA